MSKRTAESATEPNEKDDDTSLQEPPTKFKKLGDDTTNTDENNSNGDDSTSDDNLEMIQRMLKWINDLGAELSSINIAPSKFDGGGFGAFAAKPIKPGEIIGRIPNEALMSVSRSAKSVVGTAVASNTFDVCDDNNNNDHDKKISAASGDNDDDDQIIPSRPTPEFVLWLDMCHGRYNSQHFHHPYLACLPLEPPDLPSWSVESRKKLSGTNLGMAAEKAHQDLKNQYEKWMPHLKKTHPKLFASGFFELKDLMWASGMYFSRRFPSVLLDETRKTHSSGNDEVNKGSNISLDNAAIVNNHQMGENKNVGVMIPVLDLLNHRHHQQITWYGSPTHVSFHNGGKDTSDQNDEESSSDNAYQLGDEIYNNYGPKGNEMLMMMYGFALKDNFHDNYRLQLVLVTAVASDGAGDDDDGSSRTQNILKKRDLGTFQIHRSDSPMDPQFPPGLWIAINQMFVVEEDVEEENPEGRVKTTAVLSGDTDNVEDEETVEVGEGEAVEHIEVCPEAIDFLKGALQRRVQPFLTTKDEDLRCETNISTYRNGQRVVLEDAIETLEQMLPEEEEGESMAG